MFKPWVYVYRVSLAVGVSSSLLVACEKSSVTPTDSSSARLSTATDSMGTDSTCRDRSHHPADSVWRDSTRHHPFDSVRRDSLPHRHFPGDSLGTKPPGDSARHDTLHHRGH